MHTCTHAHIHPKSTCTHAHIHPKPTCIHAHIHPKPLGCPSSLSATLPHHSRQHSRNFYGLIFITSRQLASRLALPCTLSLSLSLSLDRSLARARAPSLMSSTCKSPRSSMYTLSHTHTLSQPHTNTPFTNFASRLALPRTHTHTNSHTETLSHSLTHTPVANLQVAHLILNLVWRLVPLCSSSLMFARVGARRQHA
jgi:hypothetical protein